MYQGVRSVAELVAGLCWQACDTSAVSRQLRIEVVMHACVGACSAGQKRWQAFADSYTAHPLFQNMVEALQSPDAFVYRSVKCVAETMAGFCWQLHVTSAVTWQMQIEVVMHMCVGVRSAWQKRWQAFAGKYASHPLFQRLRGAGEGVHSRGRDAAEELKERWETSDSPLVHRVQVRFGMV